ncbi:hypothetical protein HWV62_27371 [Athelia sp. TMB]|nr:hypothetical protein HWV62_27371 [Athelia sp. TMB]
MYSLYALYPISINPFKTVLFSTFVQEKDIAVKTSGGDEGSSVSKNEQLVWALWKILKGDGEDVGDLSSHGNEHNYTSEPNIHYADAPFASSSNGSGLPPAEERKVHPEEDAENESIAQAMALLLAARERVLTLSEQRVSTPSPHLLSQLTHSSMQILKPAIPDLISPLMITSLDLTPLIAHNPTLAHPLLIALLTHPQLNAQSQNPKEPTRLNVSAYLDVLKHMPPTLPSFDLLGRLLRDPTSVPWSSMPSGGEGESGTTTVADLVREEVLGRFIHEGINWLDKAEQEEKDGLIADDRFAKGVQNLCRFYTSLLKMGILDASSDADSTEMRHFALRNSHFEEAGKLFRVLGAGGAY